MLAPVQNPDKAENKINKELEVPLTITDLADRGVQVGQLRLEIDEMEEEFDKIKKEHRQAIDALEDKKIELELVLASKKEKRMVECIERKDFNSGLVQYVYDGEVCEERPMEASELQGDMFRQQKAVEASSQPELGETPAEADVPMDEQIANDIKESTNPRTASSAV